MKTIIIISLLFGFIFNYHSNSEELLNDDCQIYSKVISVMPYYHIHYLSKKFEYYMIYEFTNDTSNEDVMSLSIIRYFERIKENPKIKSIFNVLDSNLLRQLLEISYTAKQLTCNFKIKYPFYYLSKSSHDSIFLTKAENELKFNIFDPSERWDNYYLRYPHSNGFIILSKIAYNKKKDKALLNFQYARHGLAQYWNFIELKKRKNKWIITKNINYSQC